MFYLKKSIFLFFFSQTLLANASTKSCKDSLLNTNSIFPTISKISETPDDLPKILQEASFPNASRINLEEIEFYRDSQVIDNILISFYDSENYLLMKARFRPSKLLSKSFSDGSSGFLLEGVSYEIIVNGEVVRLLDDQYLTGEFNGPVLSTSINIDENSNIKDTTRFEVKGRTSAIGQILTEVADIFSHKGLPPRDIFSIEFN